MLLKLGLPYVPQSSDPLAQGSGSVLSFLDLCASLSTLAQSARLTSHRVEAAVFDRQDQATSERWAARTTLGENQALSLPPKAHADHLVEVFFTLFNSYLPLLHGPTFENEYEQVYANLQSGATPNLRHLALVNLVLAGGTHFSSEGQAAEFDLFLSRSHTLVLLLMQYDDSPSLDLATIHLLRYCLTVAHNSLLGGVPDQHLTRG